MRKWGIIGAFLFVGAVIFSYFVDMGAGLVVELAAGAFGLGCIIGGAIKAGKEKNIPTWKVAIIVALSIAGGLLCCFGGYNEDIFIQLSGAVIVILSVIFAIMKK